VSANPDRRAWFAAIAFAWLGAWLHLAGEWQADEQYRYGFGVPFLFCWMAWRRCRGTMEPGARTPAWWCMITAALLALLLGELLRWHDPLWRLTGALLTAAAALLTGAWLHRIGGAPLLRRGIFPLAFAALAVPWPVPVENWITQHLAAVVTDFATMLVNACGIAALQRGNVIELANGYVGVDDACSGIQSLQSALMVSFFLGEYFSLRPARRAALVLAGCVFSVAGNFVRIVTFTLITHAGGKSGAATWHDTVGAVATVAIFALLLFVAWKFSGGPIPPTAEASTPSAPAVGAEGRGIFAVTVAIFFTAWVWSSRTGHRDSTHRWILSDHQMPSGWRSESIAATASAKSQLRFTEWHSLRVQNTNGTAAQVIRLSWKGGARTPAFVTNHTPAVCLPSSGWKQSAPAFFLTLKVRGGELPCAAFPFERDGVRLLALQHLSSGGRPELRLMDPSQIPGTFARLGTLWHEPMRQITEEVLLYIPDPGDAEARKNSAAEFLNAVLSQRTP
jgi:exosortase